MPKNHLKYYHVPELGQREESAKVVEIYARPNQAFATDEELMVLTTDKAAFSLESTDTGIIVEIPVMVGSRVKQGDVLLAYRDQ